MKRSWSRRAFCAVWVGIGISTGCSQGEPRAQAPAPAPLTPPAAAVTVAPASGAAEPDGSLTHLEGRSGSPDALWADASYKVKREGGKLTKTLKVGVVNAPPGIAQALTCDGFALGKMVPSAKGKAEFTLVEAGEDYFPDGFEEPKRGSVIRIGELAELRLEQLEKLTDLRADFTGPGKLAGKVDFKIERLGDAVTREFEVKVTNAEEKTVHPITLDGAHIADLSVDLAGKGKLVFSTLEGAPFPAGFSEPRAGSSIEIGRLFKGELHDSLEVHAR